MKDNSILKLTLYAAGISAPVTITLTEKKKQEGNVESIQRDIYNPKSQALKLVPSPPIQARTIT